MSTILLVDDDVDLSDLIKTKLQSEGHQVEVHHSGQGAFELAKRIKPDIAILDIMLPEVTGYQICRRIRKDPELYRTAILILTALGEEPEIMHGLEQGADDYLSKPFKLDSLTEKLTSLAGLMESLQRRHALTGLPGTDAIKREINHRLARGMAIAACYIDIAGFKPYCAVHGAEGQRRVMQYMGHQLTQLTRNMGIYECFIAHMGGEHFVVLLNLEDYERFCNALTQSFDAGVKDLYSANEVQQGFIVAVDKYGREGRYPFMALAIGVAHTQYRHYKSAKKMFEVLAQTRQKAQPDGKSAIFVDRRRTDR